MFHTNRKVPMVSAVSMGNAMNSSTRKQYVHRFLEPLRGAKRRRSTELVKAAAMDPAATVSWMLYEKDALGA